MVVPLFVPKHNGPALPVLQLTNVDPRDLGETEALVVGIDALETDEPCRSTAGIGPLQAVADQHGAEPLTVEGRVDGEDGEVPGVLAAGCAEELGPNLVEYAGKDVGRVGVEVGDGEQPVAQGQEGPDYGGDPRVWEGGQGNGPG